MVEEHDTQKGGGFVSNLINQANKNLGTTEKKPLSKTQRYKANKRAKEEDFSSFVIGVITLVLSSWKTPNDELKPTEDEISAFSVPATKLLLRHTNITGKMSADVLDIIGMVAAGSAYYARTAGAWRIYNEERRAKLEAERLASQDANFQPVQGFPGYDREEKGTSEKENPTPTTDAISHTLNNS